MKMLLFTIAQKIFFEEINVDCVDTENYLWFLIDID